MITLVEIVKGWGYEVIVHNNKSIGILRKEVDGYFYYDPSPDPGYYEAYLLRAIADKLDELNKEWDEKVQRDLGNQEENTDPSPF